MIILSILIPSAETALQFLAALNRCKQNGYAGCAVAYSLLAPHIAKSTRRKCSVRTLERGLAALKKLGLVELHWWTLPDKTIVNGTYDHRIIGSGKVETRTGWVSRQIRIVVLTDRATALWDRRTAKKGSDIIPHFVRFMTPAKLAARSQYDQIDKSIMIKPPIDSSVSTTIVDRDHQGKRGQTTRSTASQPTVEQLSSTDLKSSQIPKIDCAISPEIETDFVTERPSGQANEQLTKEQKSCHDTEVSQRVRSDRKILSKGRGCTHTPPPIPKNARTKTTWPVARAYLLVEIHRALVNFSTPEANTIYERAMWELSPEYPSEYPTVVDWAYWVARFASFQPRQRRGHVFRDILPLLRSTQVPVPSERRSGPLQMSITSRTCPENCDPSKLPGFLKNLWKKYVSE